MHVKKSLLILNASIYLVPNIAFRVAICTHVYAYIQVKSSERSNKFN